MIGSFGEQHLLPSGTGPQHENREFQHDFFFICFCSLFIKYGGLTKYIQIPPNIFKQIPFAPVGTDTRSIAYPTLPVGDDKMCRHKRVSHEECGDCFFSRRFSHRPMSNAILFCPLPCYIQRVRPTKKSDHTRTPTAKTPETIQNNQPTLATRGSKTQNPSTHLPARQPQDSHRAARSR